MAKLAAVLDIYVARARNACRAGEAAEKSTRRRGVVSKSAMPMKKSSSQETLFACSSELNFPARGRSYF